MGVIDNVVERVAIAARTMSTLIPPLRRSATVCNSSSAPTSSCHSTIRRQALSTPRCGASRLCRARTVARRRKGAPGGPWIPPEAQRAWVGRGIGAWGRFEGDEPDTSFRVLAASQWRQAPLSPENATYQRQLRLSEQQQQLVDDGTLDAASETFVSDHVFPSWTTAAQGGRRSHPILRGLQLAAADRRLVS